MSKKILVAVAWPYVNGDLHLGHLAGYLLPADITARYFRLKGDDVLMVSGSDCHGTPITVEADKQGTEPKKIVEKYHRQDVELFKLYNLSYNLYTKTTTENHKRVVQELFLDLLKNDFIVKDTMQQYYSPEDEAFLPDRYVEGTCPHCHAGDQRSDQCENCGRWLKDGELLNPRSKLTGNPVELKDSEHYFLDFERLQGELRKYVDSKKNVWRDWVWKETDGWLREGLQKRAITRDMDWAIELPIEEIQKLPPEKQLSDYTGKRIYVWFEAVIGYLSAPQEWVTTQTDSADVVFDRFEGQSNNWQDWWHSEDAIQYYFMGQDNLVFHTLMWPGELMGSDKKYTLPHNVVVSKFLNYEGKKFSKSRNWTINSKKVAERFGTDIIRFYITSILPENKEASFEWSDFIDTTNNELVANLGNLINRTLKFLESKFAGKLSVKAFDLDPEISIPIQSAFDKIGADLEEAKYLEALAGLMKLARVGNKYFDEKQIWTLIKEDELAAKRALLNLVNLIAALSVLMEPFLPESSGKLRKMLGMETLVPVVEQNQWEFIPVPKIELQQQVEILFAKLDRETVISEKENFV